MPSDEKGEFEWVATGGPRNRTLKKVYKKDKKATSSIPQGLVAAKAGSPPKSTATNDRVEQGKTSSKTPVGSNTQDMKDIVAHKRVNQQVKKETEKKSAISEKIDVDRKSDTKADPTKGNKTNVTTSTPTTVTLSPGSTNTDVMNALANMLGNVQSDVKYTPPDVKKLEAMARKAADAEYDPQIAAVSKEMQRAEKRGQQGITDVGDLYDKLVAYYEGQGKQTKKRYKSAKAEAKARTKATKSEISSDYTNRLKEQTEMYKSLGIEAAAPSATAGQFADQADMLARADLHGQTEGSALNQEQMGQMDYQENMASAGKSEGAERQADVMMQLQDYLNKQGANKAQLRGQREAMYNQALSKLNENAAASSLEAQKQVQAQEGQLWQRMMDYAKLSGDMSSDQFNKDVKIAELERNLRGDQSKSDLDKAKLELEAFKATKPGDPGKTADPKGLLAATTYLGDPNLASFFRGALDAATQYKGTQQSKDLFGKIASSPEEMATIIRWHAANQGLGPAEQQKLYNAALAYYGKLR